MKKIISITDEIVRLSILAFIAGCFLMLNALIFLGDNSSLILVIKEFIIIDIDIMLGAFIINVIASNIDS